MPQRSYLKKKKEGAQWLFSIHLYFFYMENQDGSLQPTIYVIVFLCAPGKAGVI